MTDAKAYLKQIELLDARINAKLDDVAALRGMITRITPALRPDPSPGSGQPDKLGCAISKIVDLESEINAEIDRYVSVKRSIDSVIQQITDPDQFRILHMRYFEYETWEQIACALNMSYRNVCYIHGKALQSVERIIKGKNNG